MHIIYISLIIGIIILDVYIADLVWNRFRSRYEDSEGHNILLEYGEGFLIWFYPILLILWPVIILILFLISWREKISAK